MVRGIRKPDVKGYGHIINTGYLRCSWLAKPYLARILLIEKALFPHLLTPAFIFLKPGRARRNLQKVGVANKKDLLRAIYTL